MLSGTEVVFPLELELHLMMVWAQPEVKLPVFAVLLHINLLSGNQLAINPPT